ncbi:MAG: hypothetical protein EOO65_00265 [Methanosarcinales archaeon]|nr:MAG: hypothetical protein EOO65_00265 [Methanosarcinales archaeon]
MGASHERTQSWSDGGVAHPVSNSSARSVSRGAAPHPRPHVRAGVASKPTSQNAATSQPAARSWISQIQNDRTATGARPFDSSMNAHIWSARNLGTCMHTMYM